MLESEGEVASVKKNLNEAWSSLQVLRTGKMHGYDRLSDYDKQLLTQHIIKLYAMLEDI